MMILLLRTMICVTAGGVRGCKASYWEGGIRVPGFLVWPDKISVHRETWVPAVTHDFMPTVMEALGIASDHPTFPLDGVSLVQNSSFLVQNSSFLMQS